MGNFIRSTHWHHWFNPANQQQALRLAKRAEKHLERNPEAYPAEFYRFQSDLAKLRHKDVMEQIRSACAGCQVKTRCSLKTD